jgi:D-alanyl-D-alanine carboxypeptidase/D-alanyl-D-alanine-endopeptidase (penicillin-binding protein 4)
MRLVYWRRRIVVGGLLLLVPVSLVGTISTFGQRHPQQRRAAPTTATTTPPKRTCSDLGRLDRGTQPVPAALRAALRADLANYSLERRTTAVSLWIEGYGEVVARNADRLVVPASNQKILTAMGVLSLLDPHRRLTTQLRGSGPLAENGVLHGSLFIEGGGDPYIKKVGPHSIEDIAARLKRLGLRRITGDIVGDESRYDTIRKARGWKPWEMPLPAGAESALMVNSNSRQGDKAYLANPTTANADLLKHALEDAGVSVGGSAHAGSVPRGAPVLLRYRSPTVEQMVQTMLEQSDNMAAEMLTKEVGLERRHDPSFEAGMAAIVDSVHRSTCVDPAGHNDDASGVSRLDKRSVRTWRYLLTGAENQPWFHVFYEGLPVAGKKGTTLAGRFLGTPGVGRVHAKTGTTGSAVAISGFARTLGGRRVVFSIVVNGFEPEPAVPAMDAILTTVVSDRS